MSHVAHAASAVVLYRLACTIFPGMHGRKLAFIAACLHILSPAGLFLSAPNAESTYSLLSFAGAFLFAQSLGVSGISTSIQDGLLVLAGIMYGLSTAIRGNGLLNGVLFLEEAFRVLYSIAQDFSFAKSRRLAAVGLAGICTGLGFVLPQYIAYQQFCANHTLTDEGSSREWCHRAIPSIYSFVQDHYWYVSRSTFGGLQLIDAHRDNGFLRYWTLSNLPLFALAGPVLAILVSSSVWAVNVESRRKIPSTTPQDFPTGQLTGRLLRSLAIPQIVLAVMVYFCNHVQIIIRLSSGYPVWYVWAAALLLDGYTAYPSARKRHLEGSRCGQTIVQYMVIYAAVQGVLFASFLPPA